MSKSRSLVTSCSSNTDLLASHDQLASVTEEDSKRLVPVSMRQIKSWIHLWLWKNTASVSQELGLQIHATTPGSYKMPGSKHRSSHFCSSRHVTSWTLSPVFVGCLVCRQVFSAGWCLSLCATKDDFSLWFSCFYLPALKLQNRPPHNAMLGIEPRASYVPIHHLPTTALEEYIL